MEKDQRIEKIIQRIISMLEAFNNKHRREILRICYKNPTSISELSRSLKSSKKVTWFNVKQLEKNKAVILTKSKKEKHNPVYVTSFLLPEDYLNYFEAFSKDMKNVFGDNPKKAPNIPKTLQKKAEEQTK